MISQAKGKALQREGIKLIWYIIYQAKIRNKGGGNHLFNIKQKSSFSNIVNNKINFPVYVIGNPISNREWSLSSQSFTIHTSHKIPVFWMNDVSPHYHILGSLKSEFSTSFCGRRWICLVFSFHRKIINGLTSWFHFKCMLSMWNCNEMGQYLNFNISIIWVCNWKGAT